MSTNTSIGPDAGAGNDSPGNADGCGNKTLGVGSEQQPGATGRDAADGAPDMPAGVPGAQPRPGIAKAKDAYPDGPNVEDSPWELDAARGKLPKTDR